MSRYRVILVVFLVVFVAHLYASNRWGLFFPLPIIGTNATIWTWLTANSFIQSLILVFGLAHIFGFRRDQMSFFHHRTVWTIAYVILIGLVVLMWLPGLLLFRR